MVIRTIYVLDPSRPGADHLDTVTLVHFLEHRPLYHDTAKGNLLRIEKGYIAGVLSSPAFAELLVPAYRTGDS